MPKTNKTYANGAEYEPVGECANCHQTVYLCKTHPVRDEGMDKSYAAVFVPQGHGGAEGTEPASLFCQAHDPNAHLRRRVGKPAGEPLSGDNWSPLR